MASRKAKMEAARLAYENVLDDYTSGWKGDAAIIWKKIVKVEDDLHIITISKDMNELEQTAMVLNIAVTLWEAVSRTRGLHYFRTTKDDPELEPSIREIAAYMRTEILGILDHLVGLLKDPMQRKTLENRFDRIWKIIHNLSPQAANTPPPLVDEEANVFTDKTRKREKKGQGKNTTRERV